MIAAINGFAGLYLATKLEVDIVQIVGIGTGIYSLASSVVQIPVGTFIDNFKQDKDDIIILFLGSVLMGLPFIFYPFIHNEYFYYILQFITGLGSGMNLVSWRKLFAKNLDADKEGLAYGTYETIMGFSIAIFSLIAGFVANIGEEYFDAVMVVIGFVIMSGGLWTIKLYNVKGRKQ